MVCVFYRLIERKGVELQLRKGRSERDVSGDNEWMRVIREGV